MGNPTPQPEPNPIPRCQSCQHWSRRTSEQYHADISQWISMPTRFGSCSSKTLYQDSTYMQASAGNSQDLYTEDEQLYEMEDLDIELFTREDFGCVLHQVQPSDK